MIGHELQKELLHKDLPRVSLFVGPHSVGRWKMAEHLRWYYRIDPADVLRIRRLDEEQADTLREFVRTRPQASRFRLAVIDLFGSTGKGRSELASVLEYPRDTRIIIIAEREQVTHAITEHAQEVPFWLLTPAEVEKVLVDLGTLPDRAAAIAPLAGGQIFRALRIAEGAELEKVRKALSAIRTHSEDLLAEVAGNWDDEDTNLLVQWCHETLTGRWQFFTEEDRYDKQDLPLRILMALASRVRPRLAVRAQLMSLIQEDA